MEVVGKKILIVTGSRDQDLIDKQYILKTLEPHFKWANRVFVGDASGVDSIVKQHCFANDIDVSVFLANWSRYNKSAGPMRNKQMVDDAMQLSSNIRVVAFPRPNSIGTKHCIGYATEKQLYVEIYKLK